jgi:hypothetical protein
MGFDDLTKKWPL